jgi:hypothetical protein
VPQYWLKPLGVTEPHAPVPTAWTVGVDLEVFSFGTGPARFDRPPQIGRGDYVIFHAVWWSRVYASVVVLENPAWQRDPVWGERWPWRYPCRALDWVPLVEDGPRSRDVGPSTAMGKIQAGGEFAKLAKAEFDALVAAIGDCPSAQHG